MTKQTLLAPIVATGAIVLALAACGQNEAERAAEAAPRRIAMTPDAPQAPASEKAPSETGAPDARAGNADRNVPGSESAGAVGERSRVEDGGTSAEEQKTQGTARPDATPGTRPDAPSARPDTPPGARP